MANIILVLSQDELKTIMRSIYLEYSRNMLGEIRAT